MTTPCNRKLFAVVIGGLAAFASGCQKELAHDLPGAVWTSGGAANVFERDTDVFLEGGSAPDGSGRLPDGNYAFAVTDVSGDALLSGVRVVQVVDGKLARIAVAPFDASSNGVYKVWLTKASNHPGDGAGTNAAGFSPLQSRTETFRVRTKCEHDHDDDDGEGDRDDRDDGEGEDDGEGDGECECDDEEEEPTEPTEPTEPPDGGDVDENGCDDAYGSRYGDTYGDMNGDVWGDVYGDFYGDMNGNHYGDTFGDIYGDINGHVYGDVYGDWYGDLNGNHYGRHFGDRYGDTNGDIGQAWVCGPTS